MIASRASALVATLLGCALAHSAAQAQMDPPLRTVTPPAPRADPRDRAGLIDAARSGLPATLWRGVSTAHARTLILDLPGSPQSRVLRDLQFRLLTTSAAPPSPDGSSGASLLILRVERLAAMAEAESAHELLRRAEGKEDAITARLVTEALLRVDQRDSACARVKEAGDRYKDLWWREAEIVCHIHARQAEAARTKLGVLRNESDANPAFVSLATRALGGAPGAAVPFSEHGLILALLDLAGLPVPEVDSHSPGVLRAIVENKAIPLERRVAFAERAERPGVIEPSRLAEFYDVLAHRLYQVSRDTADSAIRALSVPIAAARPTPAHDEFATAGFLAALTLERFDRASEWLAAARGGSEASAAERLALLAPLAAIARLPDRPPLDLKMMERRAKLRPQTAAALDAVLLALEAAPPNVLAPLAPTKTKAVSDPAGQALLAAAQAGRVGETICRAAALAGDTPVAAIEPHKVAAILRALLLVKLPDRARSFALEYALLAGL
jgi:hypothetical protein